MLLAIAVLFALYATGFSKADNKPKYGLKTRRTPREVKKELTRLESTNQRNLDCPHRFGYLNTRKDKGVPEECVGCAELVKCMLPEE
jgi:hypothetical protein